MKKSKTKFVWIKGMVALFSMLAASSSAYAQGWADAVYGVLSGSGSTVRTITYLAADGSILGSQTLQTSNYGGANAILYGPDVAPNLADANGLILLRDEVGAVQETGTGTGLYRSNAGRNINYYANPLESTSAMLNRMNPVSYVSIQGATLASVSDPAKAPMDHFIDLGMSNSGTILTLVMRDLADGTFIPYIYRYMIPETTSTNGQGLSRYNGDGLLNYSDLGLGNVYTTFAVGNFVNIADAYVDQFALANESGIIHIKTVNYVSTTSAYVKEFDASILGKEIVSMWENDYHYLAILYDDNSVVEYDVNTGLQVGDAYSFDSSIKNILDVVRFTPILVPEPATYAAFFGLFALGFVIMRRCSKK